MSAEQIFPPPPPRLVPRPSEEPESKLGRANRDASQALAQRDSALARESQMRQALEKIAGFQDEMASFNMEAMSIARAALSVPTEEP